MKLEALTRTNINALSKDELRELLLNYGVFLKDGGTDMTREKFLELALELKAKSETKQEEIKEAEKPQEIAPDVPQDQKENPVASLFEMGYETKEDVLRALQALRKAKSELEAKENEINEKAVIIVEETARLEEKRTSVDKQCKTLEQEYKTWQQWHDKVVAAKKSQ